MLQDVRRHKEANATALGRSQKVSDDHFFYIANIRTLSVARGMHKEKSNVVACFVYFNRDCRHTVGDTDEYRNNVQGADKKRQTPDKNTLIDSASRKVGKLMNKGYSGHSKKKHDIRQSHQELKGL